MTRIKTTESASPYSLRIESTATGVIESEGGTVPPFHLLLGRIWEILSDAIRNANDGWETWRDRFFKVWPGRSMTLATRKTPEVSIEVDPIPFHFGIGHNAISRRGTMPRLVE